MAATKGIARDCSDAAGCRGGDNGWVVLIVEEYDGSRGRSRGGWSERRQHCGRHQNSGERTVVARSFDYGMGLEMVASSRGRRGVGAGDSGGDAAKESDAVVSAVVAEDGGGDSRGDETKRLREVAATLELKRRGGTVAGVVRFYSGDRRNEEVKGDGSSDSSGINGGREGQQARLVMVGGKSRCRNTIVDKSRRKPIAKRGVSPVNPARDLSLANVAEQDAMTNMAPVAM
ncbi:hypothetical protein BHM03_00033231 [Ensete ventricosum]|uniref:Uncharacterized protein n=1 Tax=Ensete ventricosum TaxID=4639 RepID=A0A445MIZ7_ENSVE|nr:hypothetical protein BHM03_00033231 [Ensete ventricosum]